MPSFGLPSSVPPGSSSLAPCMSTLVSSNVSSCQETSSAPPGPDGCMSHLFGSPHLPPPPPYSLSDAAPYSPPPAYTTAFPFGPPVLPSARFPPPPNLSFPRPISNITFLDSVQGPQSRYPPEPLIPYDRWPDRNVNSPAYYGGGDQVAKSFGHWPIPTFNSSMNINSSSSSHNNSSLGFLKSDPILPPLAPYPPVDSVTNFGPKFSRLSGFPNAAGMPSTPSASVTSPLATGHFGAFPPPNLPLDFPHSSGGRYPFNNPHAPTFLPGMDPPPAFGPGDAEFMPEPIPSYLSRARAYQPSSPFQGPDHFHDPLPPPIPSSEIGSRPITSEFPSCFQYGPPPQMVDVSSTLLSHTFSSRSDGAPTLFCTSESPPTLEFPSDFPAPFTLPYPPPHPGSLFPPYSSSPLPSLYQDYSRKAVGCSIPITDEERSDRIVGETGKLIYQHMSPEEWRWKHYEPSFADALDPSGLFGRVRPSGYNQFHGVDSTVYPTVSNFSGGLLFKEQGSTSGASRSQKEQLEILEISKAQNQSGPSLKFAASALAEMLASGSNSATSSAGPSMISRVEVTSGTAVTSERGYNFRNASSGGQARSERMLEDCCFSSESAVVHEGRDHSSSLRHEFKGLAPEGYTSGPNWYRPTGGKREISDLPDDAFCDFGAAPVARALPKAAEKMENCLKSLPMSWLDVVPQSAKGGAIHTGGQRRVFSRGSAGIIKQSSSSTGSAKLHGVVAESNTSENFNNLFSQASNLSSRPHSGRFGKVSSEPIGPESSEDPTSVIGPFASKANAASGLSLFGPHQEVSSSGLSSKLPSYTSHNDQWHANSTSCGSSPPLSQADLDLHRSITGPPMESSSTVFPNLKWSCSERSSQTEGAYLGTGFHSLTASISNLSKVLFSLDSSAVRPPDSAALEETLQSSILRLSECLLLEQSRDNRNPTTRSVGSADSADSRHARADGSLTDIDVFRHAETGGSSNLGYLKASEAGILPKVRRSGSLSHPSNANGIMATGTIVAPEMVDPGDSVISSHRLRRGFPLNSVTHSVSKRSNNDVGSRDVKDSGHVYDSNSIHTMDDDMLQLLWDKIRRSGSLSQPSNVNGIMATGTIVAPETVDPGDSVISSHRLRRGFPLNRVTHSVSKRSNNDVGSRNVKDSGHVYDSNSKHSSSSRQRCAMDDDMLELLWDNDIFEVSVLEEAINAAVREGDLEALVEGLREELQLEREENRGTALLCEKIIQEGQVSKGKAVLQGPQKADSQSNKGNPERSVHCSNSTCDNFTLDGTCNSEASGVKDQFGIMRCEQVPQGGFGEDIDSESQLRNSGEPSLNKTVQVESRLALLRARPARTAELKPSNDVTGIELREDINAVGLGSRSEDAVLNNGDQGESQRTLLEAQPTAIAPKNTSHATSRSVESRLALLQARQTYSSHDINRAVDVVGTYPGRMTSTSLDTTMDGVEERLALIHGRPDWDNELGVFTETEPCTPANPSAVDLDSVQGSFSESSLPGFNEERAAFGTKAIKAMSHITSQLLIQSETISNMDTAFSPLSEQVNFKSLEKDCNGDPKSKEADEEVSDTATQPFDGIQAVEARAHLIRSRPDWTEGDLSETETEDFLGVQICKISSTNSVSSRYETDLFEEMNEISLVRLLDSDVVSQSIKVKTTTDCPSLRGAIGETSKFDNGNPSMTKDIEEESGWEHVRFPHKETE